MIQLLFSFSGSMYVCVYDVCGASAWMLSVLSVSSHPRSIPFTTRTGIILANKQEWNSIATEFILCDQCTQLKVFHCIRVTSKRARTMFFLCTSVLYLKVRSNVSELDQSIFYRGVSFSHNILMTRGFHSCIQSSLSSPDTKVKCPYDKSIHP